MFKKLTLLAGMCAALSLVALQPASAAPGTVTCSGLFSGTAKDLIVPAGPNCLLQGATITHDVIVQENGFLNAASTTIGHDLVAYKPQQVGTGIVNDVSGPVSVGHDVALTGPLTDQFGNHSCCPDFNNTTVGHDLRVTDLLVDFELSAGFEAFGLQGNSIGHDLIVSRNATGLCLCSFGPITVGDNTVGHNLVVTDNTASGGEFGWISVFENRVGQDAICSGNSPSVTRNTLGQLDFFGRAVGPNQAGRTNTCG